MPCRCTEDWLPLGPIAPSWLIRWSNPWLNTGEPLGCQPLSNLTTTLVFKALHQFKDTIGRVIRLCLSLGVTAVFAPPRETGFQAAVESFNARWQANVWQRFHFDSLADLQSQSAKYSVAYRQRARLRIEAAPRRRLFPRSWKLNLQAQLIGCIIYLRRTDAHGRVSLLGHSVMVDRSWPHRLVRAHVDLTAHQIRFYALRRREPNWHPLLKTVAYHFPERKFIDVRKS